MKKCKHKYEISIQEGWSYACLDCGRYSYDTGVYTKKRFSFNRLMELSREGNMGARHILKIAYYKHFK